MKQKSEERHLEYKERDKNTITMLEKIDAKLDSVVVQTTKTNGRVNKHEIYFKAVWWATGAAWTIIIIGAPLMWQAIKIQIEIISGKASEKASEEVVTRLEEKYNLEIE